MRCLVEGCRFPENHTTLGHRCGFADCKHPYGHGVIEHRDGLVFTDGTPKTAWLRFMAEHSHDIMPVCNTYHPTPQARDSLQCMFTGCKHKESHSTRSHYCKKCGLSGAHPSRYCPIQDLNTMVDRYKLNYILIQDFLCYYRGFLYFKLHLGMQKYLYIKKTPHQLDGGFSVKALVAAAEPSGNALFILTAFIDGYHEMTDEYYVFRAHPSGERYDNQNEQVADRCDIAMVKCPLCRCENAEDEIKTIKGLDATCTVCLENKIETYFPACKHSPVCLSCFDLLEKN